LPGADPAPASCRARGAPRARRVGARGEVRLGRDPEAQGARGARQALTRGPIKTAPYRLVSAGLVDAFGDDATPTYPAASAPAFGSFHLKIDHFLATPDLAFDAAQVLPLQGSDHYPIFISGVQPR
jgi:hypothetical protein